VADKLEALHGLAIVQAPVALAAGADGSSPMLS